MSDMKHLPNKDRVYQSNSDGHKIWADLNSDGRNSHQIQIRCYEQDKGLITAIKQHFRSQRVNIASYTRESLLGEETILTVPFNIFSDTLRLTFTPQPKHIPSPEKKDAYDRALEKAKMDVLDQIEGVILKHGFDKIETAKDPAAGAAHSR